jgi:NhaP-type Na+/H+ or K+/H+ antiporter
MEHPLSALASIVVVGILAQWIAWRIHLPSILLLLLGGFLLGPVTGAVDVDAMFGGVLMPLVSASVAIILFEGGLNLRLTELRTVGSAVTNLVTIGILVTWALAGFGAYFILGFSLPIAVLVSAILVVTGPTVIMPLLHHIRPHGQSGPLLKWEGILNDAIGAVLAVLVLETIIAGHTEGAIGFIVLGIAKTLLIGVVLGAAAAGALIWPLRKHWVPDRLHTAVTFAIVLASFSLANELQHESGLLTVTVMGIIVANQRTVLVRHLVEFKENLTVLLLSFIFVALAARLTLDQVTGLTINSFLFVAFLVVVVRPLSVAASTLRTTLPYPDRAFLAFMAPRGVVAAAVASVFAQRLAEAGFEEADQIVPAVFLVITATVAIYGLSARPLAFRLKLAEPDPQGVVIAGASPLARVIAAGLKDAGFAVLLVDRNWRNFTTARMEGIEAYYGDTLSEDTMEHINLTDKGKFLALTPNDRINSLSALHFRDVFERNEVYQLTAESLDDRDDDPGFPRHLMGRELFGEKVTYGALADRINRGAKLKVTKLSREFTFDDFRKEYGAAAVPLFIVTAENKLKPITKTDSTMPMAGSRLISLVSPPE